MVWKCPKCKQRFKKYSAVQKHYYSRHYKSKKGKGGVSKGKSKTVYVFKPKVGKK